MYNDHDGHLARQSDFQIPDISSFTALQIFLQTHSSFIVSFGGHLANAVTARDIAEIVWVERSFCMHGGSQQIGRLLVLFSLAGHHWIDLLSE